jgi:site-specific DNA-methyltransferase (adenine-specific)
MNHLYFGDCLEVLKNLSAHNEPFIDLIYIDPPFNSKRNYNVLFENINMKDATAQKQAFADTWSNVTYIIEMNNVAELNKDLFDFLTFLDKSKAVSDSAVAYLTTMSIRLLFIHKVLKETGSFYLHCDQTMSHYLKLICDFIFGEKNFRNEIIWKRKTGRGETNQKSNKFGTTVDLILFYGKSSANLLHPQYNKDAEGYEEYVEKNFKFIDAEGRKYMSDNLSSPTPRPNLTYEYKGYMPPANGWAISKEKMEQWDKENKLIFPKTATGRIRRKRYADELKGRPVQNLWDDIAAISAQAAERLGYPTQKPEALLERIILASSNEGDTVADFFCGCGTTIAAAQKLKRKWIGADISHLAIKLILKRLSETYGSKMAESIKVHGFPKDVDSARMLARETDNGRFGFQEWVIEVLLHGVVNPKKTADGGYDGYLTYKTDLGKQFVLIETKSGHVNVKNMREFIHVIDKQKAAAGIFVCFEETVTKEMLKSAKQAGKIMIDNSQTDIDKIQILTVDDILNEGKQPHLPNLVSTFKRSERNVQFNQLALSFNSGPLQVAVAPGTPAKKIRGTKPTHREPLKGVQPIEIQQSKQKVIPVTIPEKKQPKKKSA